MIRKKSPKTEPWNYFKFRGQGKGTTKGIKSGHGNSRQTKRELTESDDTEANQTNIKTKQWF